jgi:L-alanine-DL-glutamate epimerase-like enolase superfamily enzyme
VNLTGDRVELSDRPGLGLTVDMGKIERYRANIV